MRAIDYMRIKRFGGNWQKVMERDGYRCRRCGMTNEEHLLKFNKNLTINHIDHNGRHSQTPNNELENLEVLCLQCHGSKDALVHGIWAKYVPVIRLTAGN